MKTHYDVLGVPPGSDREALRRAYVDLARRHHPDAGGDAAAMLEVNDAWAVLSDPTRRARYDWTIGESSAPAPAPAPPSGATEPEPPAPDGVDLDPRPYAGQPEASSLVDTLSLLAVMVLGLLAAVALLMGMMLTMGELIGIGVFLAFLTGIAVLARMLLAMRSSRT